MRALGRLLEYAARQEVVFTALERTGLLAALRDGLPPALRPTRRPPF